MPPAPSDALQARAAFSLTEAAAAGGVATVLLSGQWSVMELRPSAADLLSQIAKSQPQPATLKVLGFFDTVQTAGATARPAAEIKRTATYWDSSLLLFLFDLKCGCERAGIVCDLSAVPPRLRELLAQLAHSHETSIPRDRSERFLATVGRETLDALQKGREFFAFVGECAISLARLVRRPRKFRWADCLEQMQHCGAMALPIVSLVSILVGMTLGYTAALILRQYGGDIYVADLVGISMLREMGALMTAIVLAGRSGAAFAAQLGNMKASEEIDALRTLGLSPIDFLVMPRLAALLLMMPLLALYANCLGILGGMLVASAVLDISPSAYWVEMLTIIDLSDLASGLIKAATFGVIVGLAGCLRGLQAKRNAVGVGMAATSAVVTAILFIIIADALYAVVFDILGV